jgi:hypothetical protein
MIELEKLAEQARCASEWGRTRMAMRVGVVVAALTLVSLASGTTPSICAVGGLVLLATAVVLRWWNQIGVEAVRIGLLLGGIPLAAGIVLQLMGVECRSTGDFSQADLVCVLAGAIAGSGVTAWTARTQIGRVRRWPAAVLVASLTATLGCLGLGAAGILATLLTLVIVSAIAWIPLAARTQ